MTHLNYIELFAGCGGLSLGLAKSDWKGIFAIEKDKMAFETLKRNLIDCDAPYKHFNDWPNWLPVENHNIKELLLNPHFRKEITKLSGKITLLVGGPPCQGFSVGGARRADDERNKLVYDFLEFISLLQPELVLIENVEGMRKAFKSNSNMPMQSVLDLVFEKLNSLGYEAGYFVAKALDAGVPQDRRRIITFAVKKNIINGINLGKILEIEYKKACLGIRKKLGLPIDRPVTIGEAIEDLSGSDYIACPDSQKFNTSKYLKATSAYAQSMRKGKRVGSIPNSHRFSKHGEKVLSLYNNALKTQKPGRLSKQFLLENKTKTQKKFLLGKNIYASTLTTHPDEHIHYKYPRNVSLREMARLMSFPDDFNFYGRYTLNGERRKLDVSRCAQIGNAVPVLMAQALGVAIKKVCEALKSENPNGRILNIINEDKYQETLEMFV